MNQRMELHDWQEEFNAEARKIFEQVFTPFLERILCYSANTFVRNALMESHKYRHTAVESTVVVKNMEVFRVETLQLLPSEFPLVKWELVQINETNNRPLVFDTATDVFAETVPVTHEIHVTITIPDNMFPESMQNDEHFQQWKSDLGNVFNDTIPVAVITDNTVLQRAVNAISLDTQAPNVARFQPSSCRSMRRSHLVTAAVLIPGKGMYTRRAQESLRRRKLGARCACTRCAQCACQEEGTRCTSA